VENNFFKKFSLSGVRISSKSSPKLMEWVEETRKLFPTIKGLKSTFKKILLDFGDSVQLCIKRQRKCFCFSTATNKCKLCSVRYHTICVPNFDGICPCCLIQKEYNPFNKGHLESLKKQVQGIHDCPEYWKLKEILRQLDSWLLDISDEISRTSSVAWLRDTLRLLYSLPVITSHNAIVEQKIIDLGGQDDRLDALATIAGMLEAPKAKHKLDEPTISDYESLLNLKRPKRKVAMIEKKYAEPDSFSSSEVEDVDDTLSSKSLDIVLKQNVPILNIEKNVTGVQPERSSQSGNDSEKSPQYYHYPPHIHHDPLMYYGYYPPPPHYVHPPTSSYTGVHPPSHGPNPNQHHPGYMYYPPYWPY
jgi:hypothetical protein